MLLASVLGQAFVAVCLDKHMCIPKAFASRSESSSSRDHTSPRILSFALAMTLTLNARHFQRTQLSRGMKTSLDASKGIDMGVTDLALVSFSTQVVTRSDLPMYALF